MGSATLQTAQMLIKCRTAPVLFFERGAQNLNKMNDKIEFSKSSSFAITNKTFDIDYTKVKTIEDVVTVLKGLQITVNWHQEHCPEQFKEIYEKGFLIERVEENKTILKVD